jgi:electron transfer flavoprotein beta subunit
MGADRAVLLKGQTTLDGSATAKTLAEEVKTHAPDLVLCGMKAVDNDQQQVGIMLAEYLGMPCVSVVAELEAQDGKVVAHREIEGGVEIVEVPLPAVITTTKGKHEPRYPSLKGIMAAKKKPLEEKDAQVAPSRLKMRALTLPAERAAGKIVGSGADAVPELIRLLKEEAKVL